MSGKSEADKISKALEVAYRYGMVDGDHHKKWVIDQMVRALTDDLYVEWVQYHNEGDEGPSTYEWDVGIPP